MPNPGKVEFAARRKAIWGDRVFSAAEDEAMPKRSMKARKDDNQWEE